MPCILPVVRVHLQRHGFVRVPGDILDLLYVQPGLEQFGYIGVPNLWERKTPFMLAKKKGAKSDAEN